MTVKTFGSLLHLINYLFIFSSVFFWLKFNFTFQTNDAIDPKLYFWDTEIDQVSYFNFETGRGEQDDFPPEQVEGVEGDTNDAER